MNIEAMIVDCTKLYVRDNATALQENHTYRPISYESLWCSQLNDPRAHC